jgi:small subunit ribosomal protein S1
MPAAGDIIEAVVTRVEIYGVWIEHGGQRGLITIPELSWSRIAHPREVLTVGQVVRVKVLVASPGREFAASIRAAQPDSDPWREPSRFAVGAVFEAPVVRILEYGCFVELRPDVWGLLRCELWPHPLAVGDVVRIRVAQCDPETRKVTVHPLA